MKLKLRDCLRQISVKGKGRMVFSILWGSVFFCFLFPPVHSSDVRAADAVKINGVPRIDVDDPLYRNYPKRFDGMGYIDRVDANRIIIDDTPYPLADAITFNTPRRRGAPASWFKKGQYVGYLQDKDGAIKNVYLLKKE
jgi:hypothetical protein